MPTTITVTPPRHQASMRLPDGRVLAWGEWGPADGLPVLYCPGAGTSGSLGFGTEALAELGLRLLALDRPGVGRSDPHPHKTLDSWAEDTAAWIAANDLQRVGVVAFSQGAPFAFALAARGLVSALAIVSGQDEFTHPRVRPLLHPEVERMVAAVAHDPVGFEDWFTTIATPDGLWELIRGMSGERDLAVYTGDAFGAAYRRALHEGFAQGSRSYVRDLVNTLRPWPFALEQITVPVALWYGRQDTSTVHSPDFGTTLATRLPNASHRIDPEEGGSLLWTRAHAILADLAAALRTAN